MNETLNKLGFNSKDILVKPIKPLYHPNTQRFISHLETIKEDDSDTVIQWDTDVDGVCAGYTAYKTLSRVINLDKLHNYINETRTHGIKDGLIKYIQQVNAKTLIIVDAGTNDIEEIRYLISIGITVIVIDHHQITDRYRHENFILINSNDLEYGQNVSGAYMTNEVMKQVMKYFHSVTMTEFDELAVISIVSDLCERDDFNRNILLNYMLGNIPMSPFINEIKRNRPKCTVRFAISISSNLNALLRYRGSRDIMNMMLNEPHKLTSLLYNIGKTKSDNEIVINQILKKSQIFEMNNIVMIIVEPHDNPNIYARNYLGIIANKIAIAKKKLCLVMADKRVNFEEQKGDYIYTYSARDFIERDSLSKVAEVGIDANGHHNAFGGKLYLDFVSKLQSLDRVLNDEKESPKLVSPKVIETNNIIDVFSSLSDNIVDLAIWNTIQSEENKIGIQFQLQGMISQQGKIKKIKYKGFTFDSFEPDLKEGENVICVPEISNSIDFMIIKR